MQLTTLHLTAGWLAFVVGALSGAALGLGFYRTDFLCAGSG